MGSGYRVLVALAALTAVLCVTLAVYAGFTLADSGRQMLENEVLMREIARWWQQNIK